MTLKQLSIFLENRPGRLLVACRALANAGVNILTLSLADTQQFGILRVVVRDWPRAKAVLEEAGCLAKVTDVVAIEVPDSPGGLADLLEVIEHAKLNVEYMYAFPYRSPEKRGVMVFRFEEAGPAQSALQAANVTLLSEEDLFRRLEG
jgi:hypothetical protein